MMATLHPPQLGEVAKRSTTWEIAAFYVFSEVEKRNDFHLMGVALKESWTTMVPIPSQMTW